MGYNSYEREPEMPYSSFFDGDKELEEDELARRLRSDDSADRQRQDNPARSEPEQNRASGDSQPFQDPLKKYNDMMDKMAEDAMLESVRRHERDRDSLDALRLMREQYYRRWWPENQPVGGNGVPGRTDKRNQEQPKTESKGWSKYLPW
ncbi:MAG: hypothetical protein HC888_13945 [Candidatus Competibacteraceae bacterium]|nr:hypothetical protein [Candidatus Competibacteraceae bacterium]